MKPQQATACPFLALVAWATAHRDEIKCPAGLYSDIAGPAGTCLGVGAPEHHRVKPTEAPAQFQSAGRLPKALAVSLAEAGELLGVNKITILREIDRGHLRGLKVGRVWRIRMTALETYLKRREEGRR